MEQCHFLTDPHPPKWVMSFMDGPKGGGCQVVIMKYFAVLKGNGIVVAKQEEKDRQFAIAVLSDQVKSTIGIDTNSYYGRRKTQCAKI